MTVHETLRQKHIERYEEDMGLHGHLPSRSTKLRQTKLSFPTAGATRRGSSADSAPSSAATSVSVGDEDDDDDAVEVDDETGVAVRHMPRPTGVTPAPKAAPTARPPGKFALNPKT